MDAGQSSAEAVAVADGRIIFVGSWSAAGALKGPRTQVIGLAGRTMLPGFIDPHMHFVFSYFDTWLDLGPFANMSMSGGQAKLQKAIAASKPGD